MLWASARTIVAFLTVLVAVLAASKSRPHIHNGVLEPYSGELLPVTITSEQQLKLDQGDPVLMNERSGKCGRGLVIQDVKATPEICMSQIRNLENYSKVVPHVKSVKIYENSVLANGTSKTSAQFDVGLMGINVQYFLRLTHEPKFDTVTWTLDYGRNSDVGTPVVSMSSTCGMYSSVVASDDSVGHWQVMKHPSKKGWTRILYSTQVRLFSWVPEFVVKFLTTQALTESTVWVKRESEREAQVTPAPSSPPAKSNLLSWFSLKGGALPIPTVVPKKNRMLGYKIFSVRPFAPRFK